MVKGFNQPDYILLGTAVALIVLGIIILSSVSAAISLERFGNTYHFLTHQLLFALLPGILLGLLAFKINLSFLKRAAPILLLINLALLAMVFLPVVGSSETGSARWIGIGSFSFQPSELLKLTSILYFAAWLANRTERKKIAVQQKSEFGQTFLAFLVTIVIISVFLIFQPDISTLVVIAAVASLIYFSANTPFWHTILIIFAGAGGLWGLIRLAPYRLNRLLVFFNPETDPMGIGYQLKQALIAVGSGGLGGVGLGISVQKLGFLPQSISDSIFAIFSEETGFIGSLFLIFLFFVFFWRGFKIAKEGPDKFSQLTALGITSWIIIQTFVNIGSMIGIMPLTGIPLPFFSYGGSAFVAEMIGVGLLLNISKKT
jgi:cell division protein FtsW